MQSKFWMVWIFLYIHVGIRACMKMCLAFQCTLHDLRMLTLTEYDTVSCLVLLC